MSWATVSFDLRDHVDIVLVRQCARRMAGELGFSLTDQTRIAAAVSELAYQALAHQDGAQFHLIPLPRNKQHGGLECNTLDSGWFRLAMDRPPDDPIHGVARLMDELFLENRDGISTIIMCKWLAGKKR